MANWIKLVCTITSCYCLPWRRACLLNYQLKLNLAPVETVSSAIVLYRSIRESISVRFAHTHIGPGRWKHIYIIHMSLCDCEESPTPTIILPTYLRTYLLIFSNKTDDTAPFVQWCQLRRQFACLEYSPCMLTEFVKRGDLTRVTGCGWKTLATRANNRYVGPLTNARTEHLWPDVVLFCRETGPPPPCARYKNTRQKQHRKSAGRRRQRKIDGDISVSVKHPAVETWIVRRVLSFARITRD